MYRYGRGRKASYWNSISTSGAPDSAVPVGSNGGPSNGQEMSHKISRPGKSPKRWKFLAVSIMILAFSVGILAGIMIGQSATAPSSSSSYIKGSDISQTLADGDYMTYDVSATTDGMTFSGTMTRTFSNVTDDSFSLLTTNSIDPSEDTSGNYTYSQVSGTITSSGLVGNAMKDGQFIGQSSISTPYGQKDVSSYDYNYSGYQSQEMIIMGSEIVVQATIVENSCTYQMALEQTNMEWIMNL